MIEPKVLTSFFQTLEKEASMSGAQKALLGTTFVGGGAGGIVAKDIYKDSQEGKASRMAREFQQKQQIKAIREAGNE